MKRLFASLIAGTVLFLGYGSMVTIHAYTPHKCIRPGAEYAKVHNCTHSNDPSKQHGFQRGGAGGSDPMAIIGSPCICVTYCLLGFGFNHSLKHDVELLAQHGLFNDGRS